MVIITNNYDNSLSVLILGFSLVENHNSTLLNETSRISFMSVGQWLQTIGFAEYENAFVNFGYDDINFVVRKNTSSYSV